MKKKRRKTRNTTGRVSEREGGTSRFGFPDGPVTFSSSSRESRETRRTSDVYFFSVILSAGRPVPLTSKTNRQEGGKMTGRRHRRRDGSITVARRYHHPGTSLHSPSRGLVRSRRSRSVHLRGSKRLRRRYLLLPPFH